MTASYDHWLGTLAAAEELGVTLRTVYRFLDEGTLPGYRFGRVIKATDVDLFIESNRVEPGTLGHLYPPPVAPKAREETRSRHQPVATQPGKTRRRASVTTA